MMVQRRQRKREQSQGGVTLEQLADQVLSGRKEAETPLIYALTPIFRKEVTRLLFPLSIHQRRDIKEEVSDLTQDIFCSLFARDLKVLRDFRACGGRSLQNYLRIFARFVTISTLRTRSRNPYGEMPLAVEHPRMASLEDPGHKQMEAQANLLLLRKTIEKQLGESSLTLLDRLLVADESVKEIATSMKVSPSVVYQRVSRMRKLLPELV